MSNSVEGYGSITWWGFSPAVDLADLSRDSGAGEGRVWAPPALHTSVFSIILCSRFFCLEMCNTVITDSKYRLIMIRRKTLPIL